MRKLLAGLLLLFSFNAFAQHTPESFLGYEIGQKFTPHYKLVEYFKWIESKYPGKMKLLPYGETYEGRPLVLAFISSEENIRKLEEIRKNNLRATGILKDAAAPVQGMPAVVWLSYNVHGNEPSSSEAAMMTLHALVSGTNQKADGWLSNTVVIIDPCVNPDGRDRYVNWYHSVAGAQPNANPASREHNEPWPGGRSNHYNFDLNRDWAWQTQKESVQRLKMYNEWMPQIHVDFHEQGFNEPYYFAPAAEPFHEVITPWQREFQTQIGKNNAKYFDQNGWLYFTRERFDLFYPSYGDTYPTYNGAIGMTYEQGGHSRGGLAVETEDGDTLTLADRALHHFTTGMSTIEMASVHAEALLKEFRNYFSKAQTSGFGAYRSFLVKIGEQDGQRLKSLRSLLERNGIQYGFSKGGGFAGFGYASGKEEKINDSKNYLVVPVRQPRSAMVQVLFEPRSFLSDSATYDITAWALPYAYGLEAYASKQEIAFSEASSSSTTKDIASDAYAYAIPWEGTASARFLGKLISAGVRVRYAQEPFSINGKRFGRGTMLVTRAANKSMENQLATLISRLHAETGVEPQELRTGFSEKGFDLGSDRVRMIGKTRVAMLTGDRVSSLGAGEIWHFFEQELDYPLMLVNADDLGQVNWHETDVLIVPANYGAVFSDKNLSEKIRSWVAAGGRLIALENTVAQMARAEWGIKPKKEEEKKGEEEKKNLYEALKKYADRERDDLQENIPGAVYKIELDNTHPLAFGYPDHYYALKQNPDIYEYFEGDGWNVGVLKKDNYITGFTGHKLKPLLTDGWVFGVQPIGRGQVVYLNENPLFRSFWENGKLMLCNAVFLVGQ